MKKYCSAKRWQNLQNKLQHHTKWNYWILNAIYCYCNSSFSSCMYGENLPGCFITIFGCMAVFGAIPRRIIEKMVKNRSVRIEENIKQYDVHRTNTLVSENIMANINNFKISKSESSKQNFQSKFIVPLTKCSALRRKSFFSNQFFDQ